MKTLIIMAIAAAAANPNNAPVTLAPGDSLKDPNPIVNPSPIEKHQVELSDEAYKAADPYKEYKGAYRSNAYGDAAEAPKENVWVESERPKPSRTFTRDRRGNIVFADY